jgi:protein-disulfide isomerase
VTTVAATPDGGFKMGNPNAPIKLVEYGSLSCSHCAEFSAKSAEALRNNYVASGKVSYEFRSYLLGGQDVPATLLIQCGGPTPFFLMLEQVYSQQGDWLGKLSDMTPAERQAISALPMKQQFAAIAKKTGLDEFVRQRGIPAAKAEACLADTATAEKLTKMRERANTEFNLQGTPTFLINGQTVPQTSTWEALEPALKAAGA